LKILYGYRQSVKRPRFLLILVILMLASFLTGACLEKSQGLLEGLAAAAPGLESALKNFIRERIIFKINTRSGSTGPPPAARAGADGYMIRGP